MLVSQLPRVSYVPRKHHLTSSKKLLIFLNEQPDDEVQTDDFKKSMTPLKGTMILKFKKVTFSMVEKKQNLRGRVDQCGV